MNYLGALSSSASTVATWILESYEDSLIEAEQDRAAAQTASLIRQTEGIQEETGTLQKSIESKSQEILSIYGMEKKHLIILLGSVVSVFAIGLFTLKKG